MNKPLIRYLVSSPYGDIPVDKNKWHLPLEGDALKTSYKIYFQSIRDFIAQGEFKPLLDVVSKKLERETHLEEINEIVTRSEKHGFLYHPASVELILSDGKVTFGLNVAVSEAGKNSLQEEFSVLKRLHIKFNLPYLPQPYLSGELNDMFFLLEDWFEGYHEFHTSKDEEGKQKLKLWNFSNSGSGYTCLSSEQSFETYKQASKILTLYYDCEDFSQIYPWHHAAGDFVVKIENGKIDVHLTTARQYEPLMVLRDKDPVNPFLGLFCFFLNMTIRMRLDKLDGIGEVVWADDMCLEATVEGFLDALKLKKDFELLGSREDFLRLLKSFGQEDFKITLNTFTDLYSGLEDFPVVKGNLEEHVKKLYVILQNHPL